MRKQEEWDPCHGIKMRYANPMDGGFATPTIASFLQLIPKGFTTAAYRSTDASVVVVVEGHGSSTIDGQTFHWKPKDIFVVPSWKWVSHAPDGDAVIPVIHRLAPRFPHIVLTQDWHPAGHISFASAHPGRAPFTTVPTPAGPQRLGRQQSRGEGQQQPARPERADRAPEDVRRTLFPDG